MKFFIAFAALVAVVAAVPNKPLNHVEAELQAIIDAIYSTSTDPATAILLQQQLDAILAGEQPEEVAEEVEPTPVIVVDSPAHEIAPALPAPVPAPAASSPLVQIIVNVNADSANPVAVDASPVGPTPIDIVDSTPVIVGPGFETFPVDPIDTAPVIEGPVVEASEIDFVEQAEDIDFYPNLDEVEPVAVAPIVPAPVVNVPGILN